MFTIGQLIFPSCLNRWQYWLRLLILVPAWQAWSIFALSMMQANGSGIRSLPDAVQSFGALIQAKGGGSGIPPIGVFLKLLIVSALIARLRYVGIAWLKVLGGVLGVLFIAPAVVGFALLSLKKWLGISPLEGPDAILMAAALVQLPLAAVALAAGTLKGDPQRHLDKLTSDIARKPESARHYCARGTFLAGLGRETEALADFDMALKLNPKMSLARQAKEALD